MAENRRTCASCGAPNEEDARFCEGCGTSLARECATCGVEASATARFCRGCGAPLHGQVSVTPDPPVAGPVRKTVTVMFADLAGSTTFEESVDAETAREVIGQYHELLRTTAQRQRAGMTKYIGDGFMAVWGVPEIGPDDAAHAVDAAVELQENFVTLAAHVAETHRAELALRVAVNTGEVVVGAGDADLVGDALNVGARLEAECPRGRVVVGEETWRATRGRYGYESLGQVQVKGRSAPVAVYQWLGRQSESADAAPFVGRSDEVRRLQAVFDDAIARCAARLVTVIGDPGVGKSRLAAEFTAAQGDVCVIEARCAVERTVALGPIVEVLRARDLKSDVPASVPERDRLLRDLNGLTEGVAGSVEENFWALRRYVEVLASGSPVLLVLDDIQWAGTLLLDYIEHLMEWVQEVPVLVLALARPELREIRPDLVTVSRWVSEAVTLSGLDASATAELAANVLGAAQLPDELLRRLPSSTGGNPLFVRELVGMLAHDGVLVEQPTGWRLTIDVDAIAIPPTIHALLASRLERLDATDRRMLEIASVVGTDFSIGTVRALAGASADGLKRSLDRLRRLELVQPSGAYVGDEPVWRFHHVLIRDVAYRRLLKSDRADLHERLADWVASGGASVAFDNDELIARHLEAAHSYRLELGRVNEHTGEMALRAARHYATSARRALDRDELVSAGTQAARGAALANAAPAVHAQLLLTGCEAYLSAGDVAAGAPLVDELERIADDALEPWAACYRCQFIVYTAPERLLEVDARLQGAIDEFSRRADAAGLAKAHRVRASARFRLGRVGDAEIDLFEALIAARQSGDHRQITAALGAAPGAALWGPSPVPKAGGRCLDVVRMQRMTTAAPSLEATSMRHLAVLELLRGRPDKARTMLADARQIVADLGLRHGLMETELFAGIIESMEGDAVAAEPHFRTALEGLDALGVGADAGLAAALLARSVLAQGRIDEADCHAVESERLAGRNLKTAIAWRAVRAEILSAQGQHDRAVAMARDAVAVASGTDIVLDHAEACLALSRVLAAAGDVKGAKTAHADAEKLYTAKEVAASIGRTVAPDALPSPAPAVEAPTVSRLPVTNQSCEILPAFMAAMQAHDVDLALRQYSEQFVCDYHEHLGGDPIRDLDALRNALELVFDQFEHFEYRVLAVRGQRSHLYWSRVSDADGNQSSYLFVNEIDEAGRIAYQCGFDEDDFEGAYRELERRYYAGEGTAFAENGGVQTDWLLAMNRGDFDEIISELSTSDWHIENRSSSALPSLSAAEVATSLDELDAMVASRRTWLSVFSWPSPSVVVGRYEREAIGHDGEHYTWTRLYVSHFHDGRFASACQFDVEDEDGAFVYADELVRANTRRLAIANQATEIAHKFFTALRARDIDGVVGCYAAQYVHDDHRRIGGDPVRGQAAMRAGIARFLEDYTHFEYRVLAVRGKRLALSWTRFADDDGNEATGYSVSETDDAGRVTYHGRFDEDDFEDAYRELERRYYADEGAAFAEAGAIATEWTIAYNRRDFDRMFGEFTAPDFRVVNRSRSMSAFSELSPEKYRAGLEDLDQLVASSRSWNLAICWLSTTCIVSRAQREAVGEDGEQYSWSWLIVAEVRHGQVASLCQFDAEDEEAAFAYAEERVQAATTRLAVTNDSCAFMPPFIAALRAKDADGVVNAFAESFVYDDRRRLSGDPIVGRKAMRAAVERIFGQYNHFEFRIMAVRGQRLNLLWSRWSDDDGNETTTLYVNETDDDGRVQYHARFDEEDFEGAYREMEHRYYAGEGRQFAEAGATATEWMIALNAGDYDRLFGELTDPGFRLESRMLSVFGEPSGTELRASFEELNTMVSSSRAWCSACCWVSPRWAIARLEREAIGQDGEKYAWTRLHVIEIGDGRLLSDCRFDVEDDDAAFAYAEERAKPKRLAVTNRSCESAIPFFKALNASDVDDAVRSVSDRFVFDDRRRLSGDPVVGREAMRTAIERVLAQYSHFEFRVLAVRGQRLNLLWSRFSDADGNETTNLNVGECADDGLLYYLGRFDEDDFESAYTELERRYYAGEGAAFAAVGTIGNEWVTAINRGDLDRAFGELTAPDFRIENRSGSAFADRSLAELRSTTEELSAMVSSSRIWFPVVRWLSPTCAIQRMDREAVGQNGETYIWSYIDVSEVRDGQLSSACRFDIEDEDAAFAYAEERVRATTSRLALTNRAVETNATGWQAMRNHDVDRLVAIYADRFVFDDRRRLSGDPIEDRDAMRAAAARVLEQYTNFESRVLAVRGDRLVMVESRWSDDAGNETTQLHTSEVNAAGLLIYDGRFDDFDSAYRELDRRYRAGEGAAFAEAVALQTEWMLAMSHGDLDRVFGELSSPDLIAEDQTRVFFPERSASEFRSAVEELFAMVGSARTWISATCFVSPTWCVARNERETGGRDGMPYAWSRISVAEVRDGRVRFVRQFEIEDEDAAFAFAEEQARKATGHLAVINRASRTQDSFVAALRGRDVDGAVGFFADRFVYDDRRHLTGDPIPDKEALRTAVERILEQYSVFDVRTLAVRGERQHLFWGRWGNDAGYETAYLFVREVDDDGRIVYERRFDEDAFESAYRELDRRYFAGEGAAFAEYGATATEWITALNRSDYDRAFGELSTPGMRVENRSRAPFPDRSAAELRATFEELSERVAGSRTWLSAMKWFSPNWFVVRLEREATGQDGEHYQWLRVHVIGLAEGRMASVCQFEIDDLDAAFAYAEEQARASTGRLVIANRSTETAQEFWRAIRARDVDGVLECCSDQMVYDARRRLSGDPILDRAGLRVAFERILGQYNNFEARMLAVRGEHLHLAWSRWSNDAGCEAAYLHVSEVDDNGKIIFEGRFDEDDFVSAYRELNERYYTAEGAAFAEAGAVITEYAAAENRGDFDRAFGELSASDFRVENRSRSVFGDRSAAEFRASREELGAMVDSVRSWHSAVHWLSPIVGVGRFEREARGRDGEQYVWSLITIFEVRDGRLASTCMFELDDEEAAFAYAEELTRASASRLAVANRASQTSDALGRATAVADVDGVVACYADSFVFDDRRRLSGDPVRDAADLRRGVERIFAQYNHFDKRTLAVRGDRLTLLWSRWWDDAGNETAYLHVREIDDGGRFTYDGRFDDDDFEGAYRELEQRYYAGEGAPFAESGATMTEFTMALNQGNLDRVLDELTTPGIRVVNRSRAVFDDRSADEFRAWEEQLATMVASTKNWSPAVCWLSPTSAVLRFERDAVGPDNEQYTWTGINVVEFRDGRLASTCLFEADDEDAAFAYAEEQARATATRLPTTNRASQTADAGGRALNARDVEAIAEMYAESFVFDDRRRIGGNPIGDLQIAQKRILEQYNHFEGRTLAVRGEHLSLAWSRWSNESGYETTYLFVHEVDDSGRFTYEGRFDEDNLEAAYRTLEQRYYASEGAAFAAAGSAVTEYPIALAKAEFDRLFGEIAAPGFQLEDRSRSLFGDRSENDLRATYADLLTRVGSLRIWHSTLRWLSPNVVVARFEQEADGLDGEHYTWTHIDVAEIRAGQVTRMCLFETDDEAAAFAYAEERVRATATRLPITNRAKHTWDAIERATLAGDLDGAAAYYSPSLVYDDRRRLSGNPIEDMRSAVKQIAEQYTQYEFRSLAIRGDRLQLASTRWVNDSGFESNSLWVHEVDDDGLISYQCRFDEDDFEGAYRELDNRYFAGDGAAFSEAGAVQTEWLTALNRGDLDRLFGELTTSDMRFEIRSSSAFPDSTTTEARAALEDLNATLASTRTWLSATCWVSPTCCVTRFEREALGRDGEEYAWTRLSVVEYREGRMASECDFELNDEEAAFAYAENQVRSPATLLPITNRASRTVEAVQRAMDAHDVDGVVAGYSDSFEYDDRRRLSGDPIVDVRAATERVLQQYTHFERRTLAVRGEHLVLGWGRRSNKAGFETAYLVVREIDDDGLIVYQARFDEDDFNAAYRELTRRFCAGEGAAVAGIAALGAEFLIAVNEGAFDRMVNELTVAGARIENRTRSGFPDRSVAELRASFEDLNAMVGPTRSWNAVERWLSPTCGVVRSEREAYGQDGEHYEWTMLVVFEASEGRATHLCEFDLDDEAAAFAYAEERARAANTRLPITNRARRAWDKMLRAASALDADAMIECYNDSFSWEDRRHLALDRPDDLRKAFQLVMDQYGLVESRTLAVRGDSLHLGWCRWSNDAGYETTYLFVHEVGDDERWVYEGRFDEDDFNAAYRQLEERYYTGEGAVFAEAGAVTTDVTIALNGDLDRVFDELFAPDVRLENYSRSMLVDVSASEYRASLEELNAVVASVRTWNSAVRWLSPSWNVVRYEREALGRDSEQYTWSRICVTEVRNGRMTRASVFEVEDEERAFAYAEERIRLAEGS